MKNILYSFIIVIALLLTGCANAGKDQTVNSGNTVTLDATASTPSVRGELKEYKWMQIKGPRVTTLSNASSIQATFTAPTVTQDTTLVFKLRTIEYGGRPNRFRSYDTINIIVKATSGEVDTQAPVITLNGAETITLNLGDQYNEEGASAVDNIDGTVDVNITGNVITTQEGNYTITYTAKDVAGNIATKERTITVKDTQVEGPTVSGRVTDINGTAISGAIITIQGKRTSTDTNGTYSIDNIEPSERVSVDVLHPEYLANSRILVVGNEASTLDIKLGAPKATLTFASTAGGTVSQGTASVELPANAYVDANGTAYTGNITVNMSYYPITTRSGRATFPGTFEGIEGNTTFPIQSYGFMNVELTDPQGNVLNLDGNSTATLKFPRDNTLNYQVTIPLWYYDKLQGYWVQEGEATVQDYSSYVGTVTHFTSWNLDAKGPRASFTGCVEDENGTRIKNAKVQFRSNNWDSYEVPTDENGSISVYNILAKTDLTFNAHKFQGYRLSSGTYPSKININEGENRVLDTCLVIKEQGDYSNLSLVTVKGTMVDYQGNIASNAPIYVTVSRGKTIYSGNTNIDGTFNFQFPIQDALTYTIGNNFDGYLYGKDFTLQPNTTVYDVGQIRGTSSYEGPS